MSTVANPNYKKGFVPFAIAALLVSLIGGFRPGLRGGPGD